MTDPRRQTIPAIRAALADARGVALRRLMDSLAEDPRPGVRSAVESTLARERAASCEARRLKRLYELEAALRAEGFLVVAGVDEVGRGALAGPLTAAACVLPAAPRIEGLNDSKQLSPHRRVEIATVIRSVAVCYSVAHVSAAEVDALGMTAALRRVAGLALAGLTVAPDHVIVDGHPMRLTEHETAVVKGDAKVAAVAAASVLAKVERDALMAEWAAVHPDWAFEENKGYGTPEHLAALDRHGWCAIHRRSFQPGGGTGRLF